MRDGIFEPTWEEVHGEDPEPKPFDEFFSKDESDDLDLLSDLVSTTNQHDIGWGGGGGVAPPLTPRH